MPSTQEALHAEDKRKLFKQDDSEFCAKYEQKNQISSGAFSSVFCIKQIRKKNRILYAAKYLKASREAAKREVEILVKLRRCSQVVTFIEVFHCQFYTILVTEYLPGGDLFERLSAPEYHLTEEKCQVFIRQIIQGMEFIHATNIIHLDVKPFNILFTCKNTDFGLKLIDFGLARQLGEEKEVPVSKLQGTIEYMAPEVMNCKSASPSSDMWSVGVVAYMLLSGGKSPFYCGSRYRTMARSLSCEYDLNIPELSHTSAEAKDLVENLLISDPTKRLTAEQCLSHAWLADADIYIDVLHELETTWMRRCLARRRWYRALNALKAMHTMVKLTFPETVPDPEIISNIKSAAPTRIAVAAEELATPKDMDLYKDTYENVALVGSGTFGSVYYARHRETENIVASKYLIQEKEKVKVEAEVLRDLIQSAFVVQLVGLYESSLNCVLVTEYLAGGDLVTRTAADEFCLTERKCQIFIRQLVRGVQYIHSQGIIHLDLKPFNIMFANPDDDYNLRIIDFGLSERLSVGQKQVKMSMCGTLEYMSPEVMDCKFASAASDMWGVGVISYLLVSGGVSPFWAGNRYRTMAKTLSCDYTMDMPNFQNISENAKDFISMLLIMESKDRYTALECLSHPWLTDNRVYVDVLHTLQTAWMKGILARRRWHRWYHAITAMRRIRKLSAESSE
eukprot:GFUD01031348.1.p1 GENE.GFUD01031348.1~~GFUD01031348.1.p1  ORF type:complete len:678 (-),score=184.77 GFUD01031348.1:119-2152(-)